MQTDTKPTLLFVDDEERILRSLRMMFSPRYNVRITTDGNEALRILRNERVEVLVSDQRMPIMTGLELLKQAREIAPDTMRILLTGYADLTAIVGSINEGEVFRFVNKPWDAADFKATVDRAAEIAQSLAAVAPSAAMPAVKQDSHCILVVDESPDPARQIADLVNEFISPDIKVVWAKNVDEALSAFQTMEISVMVSEAQIAGTDVTSLVKSLKRHNPRTVSILLTTFYDASMLIGLINQAQVYRFIPKPVRPKLMLRAIEGGLESYRAFQLAPVLIKKHAVEKMPEVENNPIASKILNFFSSFRAREMASTKVR